MNRAAEKAVPAVADIFADAIRQMTVQDALSIVGGEPDAGTQYFRRVTSDKLRASFLPIVGKDLIRTCLDRLHDAVSYIHQATLDGMNAGKDIFTLMREVSLPENLYVGQAYGKVSFCVRTVWEQYMGWFQGYRTSELLSVQPHHISGELAAMAGVDAVIARARDALEKGDAERAMALVEAALAAEPGNRAALDLSVAVHEALLAGPRGAENFWYAGWLRHQIAANKAGSVGGKA